MAKTYPEHAPLVIFTYNRPDHTIRLLDSLKRNPGFLDSPVTIYCDAPKSEEHEADVAANRAAVREHAPKHARIVEREENFGLAKSIITGVTETVNEHGSVIVLEDDLVPSAGTLPYLNAGLQRYGDQEKVMHVAAYMFPVAKKFDQPFFYREATCWAWATWDRAWAHFNADSDALLAEIDARKVRHEFDVRGSMFFYQMLKMQSEGRVDSWAIRWYASMFLNGGLALHPARSYVENLGFDGTGVHCNVDDRFIVSPTSKMPTSWPDDIVESERAIEAMIAYRDNAKSFKGRMRRRVVNALGKLNPFA